MTKPTCTDCNGPLGRSPVASVFFYATNPNDHNCENPTNKDCQARLCKDCHGKRPLLLLALNNNDNSGDTDGDDFDKTALKRLCKTCHEELSTVDYAGGKPYTIVDGGNTGKAVFVFVHGASATRQMYYYHALELKETYGHSSILLDLPGHGTLVETPLTLQSATETVQSVLQENKSLTENKKLIYVGTSLGAYIGFFCLGQLQGTFDGAVLMDCGQNVGPGASFKARAGLVLLNYIGKKMTNAALMKLMLGAMKKSTTTRGQWYHLLPSIFGAGMHFEQAAGHVECLRQVAPAELLPSITIPIVYMNGSEDYRDSEDKWLALTPNKNGSELKVYDKGDHFFSHDKRFVPDILERMDALVQKV